MRLTTAPSLTLLDLLAPGYPGLLPACGAPLYVRFGLIATEFARRGKLSRRATSRHFAERNVMERPTITPL
jgi:hypothetical protein